MANTQFVVNTQRFDPYKTFRFHVYWDGKLVAGISKVSALNMSVDPVEHREGGDPSTSRKSPTRAKFNDITLERGLTHDPEFEKWAQLVWNNDGPAGISLKDFRKDIRIVLLNEQATPVKAYNVFRCWVKEYEALPALDSNTNAIAIEKIVLVNEGWERDTAVVEPTET